MPGQRSSSTSFFVNRQTALGAALLLLALTGGHVYWLSDMIAAMQADPPSPVLRMLGHDGFLAVWAVILLPLLILLLKSCAQLLRLRPVAVVTADGLDLHGAELVHIPSSAIFHVYERNIFIPENFGAVPQSYHIFLTTEPLAKRANGALPFPLGKLISSGNPVTINPIWIDDPSLLFTLLTGMASERGARLSGSLPDRERAG